MEYYYVLKTHSTGKGYTLMKAPCIHEVSAVPIPYKNFILWRVVGGLEPIPAVLRQEAGYTINRSPAHHGSPAGIWNMQCSVLNTAVAQSCFSMISHNSYLTRLDIHALMHTSMFYIQHSTSPIGLPLFFTFFIHLFHRIRVKWMSISYD